MPAASASATRTYCGSGFFRITATYITGRNRKACTICETQTVAMNRPSDVIAPERSSSSSSALAIRQHTPIGAYLSTRECMISATNLLTCMSASRCGVENLYSRAKPNGLRKFECHLIHICRLFGCRLICCDKIVWEALKYWSFGQNVAMTWTLCQIFFGWRQSRWSIWSYEMYVKIQALRILMITIAAGSLKRKVLLSYHMIKSTTANIVSARAWKNSFNGLAWSFFLCMAIPSTTVTNRIPESIGWSCRTDWAQMRQFQSARNASTSHIPSTPILHAHHHFTDMQV